MASRLRAISNVREAILSHSDKLHISYTSLILHRPIPNLVILAYHIIVHFDQS